MFGSADRMRPGVPVARSGLLLPVQIIGKRAIEISHLRSAERGHTKGRHRQAQQHVLMVFLSMPNPR